MATTSILTNKGASIIDKAITDEAKCVISRVVTSTHYENLPTELAAKSPFWWDGAEGTVTGLSLVNASLDVKVHWNARQDAQPVKSVGLMVKRAGAEKDYLLYAESYSNTAVTLERALDRIFSLPINIPAATFDAIGNTLTNEMNEEIGEIGGDMSGLGASLAYDGENTLIQLKNTEGEVLSSIDASDFVIDGMVESVDVVDGYLVITFNTAAGKSDISIPVTDFFDASQYYTKTETDSQISSAITALNLGAAAQKAVDSSITAQSDANLPTSSAVKGYVGDEITALNLGAASQKAVDTSIGVSSDANLPTSGAVKSYVSSQLPTVNNASVTIKKNSGDTTNPFSFTLNQSSDAELNLGMGGAAVKDVDTSIGSSSSSNLPTTDAVKAYVEAHSGGGGGVTLEFDNEDRILTLKDSNSVVLSSCVIPEKADVYEGLVLTATANNSSVKLVKNGTLDNTFEVNRGSGWEDYTFGTVINLNNGESCKWRCKMHPTTQDISNFVQFIMTGTVSASGNCNSMLSRDFENLTSIYAQYNAFYRLFYGCKSLTQAPNLPATTLAWSCYREMFQGCTSLAQAPVLPATAISAGCYFSMFQGCTSLTQAPVLPATTLNSQCYQGMFKGCTSLTQAPSLPATTLNRNDSCYQEMFQGCTSLTQAPVLPATELTQNCYQSMFANCTSLTQAPNLPATTLAWTCYEGMFYGCTSLTQAPNLPATTLIQSCYNQMFYNCTSLNEVHIAATDISAYNCLNMWLYKVSATGDFYCDSNTNFPTDSASGIPSGWTRHDIDVPTTKALTLTAKEDDSSVKLIKNGTLDNTFEVDTGNGWEDYAFDTVIPLNAGESCKWRCSAHPTTQGLFNCVQFVMTGSIEASGNCNSMLNSDFENLTSLSGYDYAFCNLFKNCASLTKAPELPATTLAQHCYNSLFAYCTSLIQAPELPATTLASDCYNSLFFGCTSLTQAPELPVTTLDIRCYMFMFVECTALTQAPELPATILATNCYFHMFRGCTALTQAPELPATTLVQNCYGNMFKDCSALTEVRIAATDISATNCLNNWLLNVAATGDFYCDPIVEYPTDSESGIPSGWTRHALADYPTTP